MVRDTPLIISLAPIWVPLAIFGITRLIIGPFPGTNLYNWRYNFDRQAEEARKMTVDQIATAIGHDYHWRDGPVFRRQTRRLQPIKAFRRWRARRWAASKGFI